MNAILAQHRFGRILLHLVCAVRTHRLHWHWLGIRRELACMPVIAASTRGHGSVRFAIFDF